MRWKGYVNFTYVILEVAQFKGSRIPKMAANFNLLLKRDQVHG